MCGHLGEAFFLVSFSLFPGEKDGAVKLPSEGKASPAWAGEPFGCLSRCVSELVLWECFSSRGAA